MAVSEVARLPGASVWAVDCCGVHTGWSDVEVRDDHRLVLVRGGRFVRRIGRRESVADPTVAYLGIPGEVEQFAHPAGGDRCTSISVRPELWRAIAGDHWTLGRSDVYVDARVDLLHRRLLRAGRTGDVHFALAEEAVRLVAVVAVAASRARSRSHRRGGIPDHVVAAAARAAVLDDEPGSDGLIPLAGRFGVSPFALSRAFSAVMGVSLTRYRNRVRVGRALERIENGDRDLAGLAADLGFSDQAHMTRTIGAHLGETPTALRTLLSA
ncbi:helix-turn-helix domain-containing protein [Rhodococcus opacus]|uniref:helix-turn-helix domain-containing protein n=1 Tax=Rhodococcus opacus TaxID=37919 RepID=UPI001F594CB9|nr:helix-turn-helix domain-containing protein [Rhodococcus opacus]MDJ0419205.1 helix-turn-helix domain-containing protein [Rhodococcus opacus]MDV6246156.1 helix-turn-helix domain-containing protein [Rhodococcus opacus]UNN00570.1 helix-turn-helix domain-containing protein [Rhodococcus opacus]UZG53615.1 helix-turn-helix domain-containing protein [Rhodococcus opacus]